MVVFGAGPVRDTEIWDDKIEGYEAHNCRF